MKQLGVLDSAFINLERPNTPQHIGGFGIYDPSTAPAGFVRFKDVISNFEHRLNQLPLFRTRLVEVAGGLDRPYWVTDQSFDLEFHMRHIALPAPGDWRQLCIQVARLHARPLDMSRPLWEAYIIEGLDNITDLPKGSFAIYTKIHHSLIDGAAGQAFIAATHDLEPNPAPGTDQLPTLNIDQQPTQADLLSRALVNQARNSLQLTRGSLSLARDVAGYGLKIARKEIPAPDIKAPRTRFNKPVGPHRAFEACTFKLDDIKQIKNAAGVTINDVALGVISGAMRRYLQHYGELPEASLAASMPVNMRTRRGSTEDNNQVGSVFTQLHTNEADPIERLRKINTSTLESKSSGEASPLVDALKLAGVFAPWFTKAAARLYTQNELSRFIPANTSTVISNVPGPNFDLYCAGARMVRYHGLGLLTPGVSMFHLVFSSSGILTLSVLADRDILPDPEFYRECLEQSFGELQQAVHKPESAATPRLVRARRKAVTKKAATKKAATKKAATKQRGGTVNRRKVAAASPKRKPAAAKATRKKSGPTGAKSKVRPKLRS